MAKNQKHYTPEFKALQKEMQRLKIGNEILKKATDIRQRTIAGIVAFEESKQRYGAVKICRSLNNNGTPCSLRRVQRHMAVQGLRSVMVKKYNHHVNYGTVPDNKEHILGRNFEAESINQKWCTDITYIHVLKEGWTYLASVMDSCSRKIIGYAGTSMTAELAVGRRECLSECEGHQGNPYDNASILHKAADELPVDTTPGIVCNLFNL